MAFRRAFSTVTAIKKRVDKVVRGKAIHQQQPHIHLEQLHNEVSNTCHWLRTLLPRNAAEAEDGFKNVGELAGIFVCLLIKLLETHRLHCAVVNKAEEAWMTQANYKPPSKRAQNISQNYQNKGINNYMLLMKMAKECGQTLTGLLMHLNTNAKYFGRGRCKRMDVCETVQPFRDAFDDLHYQIEATLQAINVKFDGLAMNLNNMVHEKFCSNNNDDSNEQQQQQTMEHEKWKGVSESVHKTLNAVLWAKKLFNNCRDAQDEMEMKFKKHLDMAHDKALRLRQWLALMVAFALFYLLLIYQIMHLTWAIAICVVYATLANSVVEWSVAQSSLGRLQQKYQSDQWSVEHLQLPT